MRKLLILVVPAVFLFAYCGSAPKVEKPNPDAAAAVKDRGFDTAELKVKGLNSKLSSVSLKGFPSWGSKVDSSKWDLWAKLSAPAVNAVAKEVPDGYVLQITGHATKAGSKSRNLSVSKKRAKYVWSSLKKQGLKTDKITYKGVGYSEPIDENDPTNPENRRVSFKIVKK